VKAGHKTQQVKTT